MLYGYMGVITGLYSVNGKENGNYYSILGAYKDLGRHNNLSVYPPSSRPRRLKDNVLWAGIGDGHLHLHCFPGNLVVHSPATSHTV